MFTYYQVNGRYNFTHYGKATSFARQINGKIVVKKSWNPLRIVNYIMDAV